MKSTNDCVAVINGVFCICGGVMERVGGTLMSNPPQQKMKCHFCGLEDFVLSSESETKIYFKAIQDEKS